MKTAKSFDISKHVVMEAFSKVKENRGAAGVDGESIAAFEENLKDNLYTIWNRMSSGSYFPPPVRMVEIPKKGGGTRMLGVASVSDRVAQTVVKIYLEPEIEPHFCEDSYGYRPGKSALDAVGKARTRCWQYNWCIDLDIQKFFDTIDRDLLMRAVRKHTDCPWILLYIERWLKAPLQMSKGEQRVMERGVFQGNVISPLLANLFLHYAFDVWLKRNFPNNPYERYADDALVHCRSYEQAERLRQEIETRLSECGLTLHPEKTKIVYCKDENRQGQHQHEKFNFLGYTFRARRMKNRKGEHFVGFGPAISNEAKKSIQQTVRHWKIHLKSDKKLEDIAYMFNATIHGWMNYYGEYYKSEMYPIFQHLNHILARWSTRKYKKLRGSRRRAHHWLGRIAQREPKLFAHWKWVKPSNDQTIRAV